MLPNPAQKNPLVQLTQSSLRSFLVAFEYVPGGQGVGDTLPDGQYEPAGHSSPVFPSVGLSVLEPLRQKNPAAQSPDGSASASAPQNFLSGQVRGCELPFGQ